MWIRRLSAAAALTLLAGCAASESEETPQLAPQAPESAFTIGCPAFTDPASDAEKDRLPELSLECLGSGADPVSIGGQPPRPTVVNLWASWCGPCLEEMPLFDQLAQQGTGQVDVLGIVTNDNRSAATAFAVEMNLSFPSALDPKGKIVADQGFVGLPGTLMLDSDGVIVFRHLGPYVTLDDLRADVVEHLGVSL